MTFEELGVSSDFLAALNEMGISDPTEIQELAIPFLLKGGTDFIGQAQTGTGKTAAFGLPILQSIDMDNSKIQALILAPTRELTQQIAKQLFRFTKYAPGKIFSETVFGGAPIGKQIIALRRPTQILVATPGRLVDLSEKGAVDMSEVRIVVLDEADEMLSMGFQEELLKILQMTKNRKATWLFSATLPEGIMEMIKRNMASDAKWVRLTKNNVIQSSIEHSYMRCTLAGKTEVLEKFLEAQGNSNGIVFCRTKASVQKLGEILSYRGVNAGIIHGDMLQKDRDKIMRAFRKENVRILVATDLAARGLDIKDMGFVVHFNLPDQIDSYTHRSGRTGRAGKTGLSVSLVTEDEFAKLKEIESVLGIHIREVKS